MRNHRSNGAFQNGANGAIQMKEVVPPGTVIRQVTRKKSESCGGEVTPEDVGAYLTTHMSLCDPKATDFAENFWAVRTNAARWEHAMGTRLRLGDFKASGEVLVFHLEHEFEGHVIRSAKVIVGCVALVAWYAVKQASKSQPPARKMHPAVVASLRAASGDSSALEEYVATCATNRDLVETTAIRLLLEQDGGEIPHVDAAARQTHPLTNASRAVGALA